MDVDDARAASDGGDPVVSTYSADPDMAELIQLFVGEMGQRIAALETCCRNREFSELKRIAHQLKGASGGYGFPSIGAAAGLLEEGVARAGSASDAASMGVIRKQVEDLVSMCRRVRAN